MRNRPLGCEIKSGPTHLGKRSHRPPPYFKKGLYYDYNNSFTRKYVPRHNFVRQPQKWLLNTMDLFQKHLFQTQRCV